MVMDVFADFFTVIAQFVSQLFNLPFFGFSSFLIFALVCFALYLVGWVLKGLWGGADK